MDDEEYDGADTAPVATQLGLQAWTALIVGAAAVSFLPDVVAEQCEPVWRLREHVRRVLRQFLHLTAQGPIFKCLAAVLRKCSFGLLASRCRPPHSLQAEALGRGRLLLQWTAVPPEGGNIFHEEQYHCAWSRLAGAGAGDDDRGPGSRSGWQLRPLAARRCDEVLSDSCGGCSRGGHGSDRFVALLDELPRDGCVRIRLCAINSRGQSTWSKEEIEVDMDPTSDSAGVGRTGSRVVPPGGACLRCRSPAVRPEGSTNGNAGGAYAEVVCRPLFSDGCPHGPFCKRCRSAIGNQAVPSCVCRALIGSWREGPPGEPLGAPAPEAPSAPDADERPDRQAT